MKKIIYKIQRRLVRSCGKNINYETMNEMISKNKNIIIIDVRTEDEYMDNHINGAVNIPLQDIKEKISSIVKNKDDVVIVYCEYGERSSKACNKLEKMGYVNVYNLDGGIEGIE